VKWVFFLLLLVNLGLAAYLGLLHVRAAPDRRIVEQQVNPEQIRILPEPPPAPRASCLEWGSFNAADLSLARAALAPLALGARLSSREVTVPANWWIHVPPAPSQAAMERKVRELNALGITNFYAITEPGKWRYAISLGLFRSEQGANAFLAQLRAKGVRSAVIGNRDQRVTQTVLVVREPDSQESARLAELAAGHPGTELKSGECPR
jgi:hypothetical protein